MYYRKIPSTQDYEVHSLPITADRSYVMTTDGIIDQIGGKKGRAFGKKRFKQLLLDVQYLPMSEQRDKIIEAFETYRGVENRRDDISMLGFRPPCYDGNQSVQCIPSKDE